MEPIQVIVTIKLDEATQNLLSSLFQGVVKPTTALVSEQPKPVAAPAKPAEQSKPVAAPAKPAEQPKPVAAPAKPVEQPKPTGAQPSITIDDLRELAMTKMNAHRVEIKQKLTELGTPSITKLDQSKYQEMFEFLRNLS